ncbi:MAG TPA: pyridoxal-phosphate dependent enzyme [Pyrinomonadaceae bacterium]|jgi:cysteine synthase
MPLRTTENIIELVGNTPLLYPGHFCRPPRADIYARLECRTPGGSVKDRTALGMILDEEECGALRACATIIEPTAGNTGIGLEPVGVGRGCHKVEGRGQYQFIPGNFDRGLADEIMMIMDDEAFATVRRLAETEGVLGQAAAQRERRRPQPFASPNVRAKASASSPSFLTTPSTI